MTDEKAVVLRPHPDRVHPDNKYKYWFGKAVPVNIFIDGQKVEAPKAGIKIGRPIFPDTNHSIGIITGDFIDDKGSVDDPQAVPTEQITGK